MSLYDKAFWWSLFFLAGVLVGSFSEHLLTTMLIGATSALVSFSILFISRERHIAIASLAIFLGSAFSGIYGTIVIEHVEIPFGEKTVFTGIVKKSEAREADQVAIVSLMEPHRGKLRITLSRYPEYAYGDVVRLIGIAEKPEGAYSFRLMKDGIFGTMRFPQSKLIGSGAGSLVFRFLARIKELSIEKMREALPPEKAAFLAGITLGETGEFTKEFKEKLQATGTSHLVALSGYNIAIVANAALAMFGFWFGRRKAIIASGVFIVAFVVMTGAEASVVRAAIMAGIVMLAESSRRVYSFRNAIVITALLMVLANPRVLVWDLGFQLSFAAIMGIVYLRPALISFFSISSAPGILNFRENFWSTLSAELAVFPILMTSFGFAPIIGIIANVLVLGVIPLGMAGGVFMVAASFLSVFLGDVLGWIEGAILGYVIWVIDFFSKFDVRLEMPRFGVFEALLCYAVLIAFVVFANHKKAWRA